MQPGGHAWRHVFMACSKLEARGHLLHKTGTPPKHFSRECTLYMTKQVEDFFQKVWPSSNILTLKVENCDFQETKYFFPFEKKSTVY